MELTREQIDGINDLTVKEVKVPEWGGSVFVRMMSGDERDAYEASAQGGQQKHVRARLIAVTLCDSTGKLLYTLDELEKIGSKGGAALDRIFAAAARHNRITPADIEELKKSS